MAEYIDREALLDRLKFKRDTSNHMDGRKRCGLDSAISQVRKAPTADVVEVVRCKDCRYKHDMICYNCRYCRKHTTIIYDDDYCSYAEKMDGKGEK